MKLPKSLQEVLLNKANECAQRGEIFSPAEVLYAELLKGAEEKKYIFYPMVIDWLQYSQNNEEPNWNDKTKQALTLISEMRSNLRQSAATTAALKSELAEAKRRWEYLENQRLMEEKAARELNQKLKSEVEELRFAKQELEVELERSQAERCGDVCKLK